MDWKKYGKTLDEAAVSGLLDDALRRAFEVAKRHVREMQVKCVFKGVTYELLSDPRFIEATTKAIPTFANLYREFDALRLVRPAANQSA